MENFSFKSSNGEFLLSIRLIKLHVPNQFIPHIVNPAVYGERQQRGFLEP